ncbi:MAG: DUF559 domain-containing protein [gamma proteobacterium symbiont of Bathyaustriella thionipta]|nr:DUF559 domain-containing protein [gamma proteobacterium symbiont of Bathyaustriella thionipta]
MKPYNKTLKSNSQKLRNNMTEAEKCLWSRLRSKQVHNAQFYRQKPILDYIVDFYCPKARLVIELDGGQHFDDDAQIQDAARDKALSQLGLYVLRFDNRQVLLETGAVADVVFQIVGQRLNPP